MQIMYQLCKRSQWWVGEQFGDLCGCYWSILSTDRGGGETVVVWLCRELTGL